MQARFRSYSILLLLALIFISRLYQVNAPLVDSHSWNQVSAASMAKHIYYDWEAVLYPKVDVLPHVDATSTIYFQEFPLYHIPIALFYHAFGVHEWPGRVFSALYGLLGLYFWFLLIKRLFNERIALWSTFFAGFCSLNWFYHQAIMSDTSMVAAMVAGFYYFFLWLEEGRAQDWWKALAWTIAAGLFKTFGLVIGVSYLVLLIQRRAWHLFRSPSLYLFAILAWLPSIIWIYHALSWDEGITEFSSSNQILHPELWIDWQFYSRLLFSRIIDNLLTPWAAFFAIIALWKRPWKQEPYQPLIAWLIMCGVYLFAVQRGNYVHDYYQLMFIPALTTVAALGVDFWWNAEGARQKARRISVIVLAGLFWVHSAKYAYNHFQQDIGSYLTGKQIAALSQDTKERVIAFDVGSSKRNQLIYYSERQGWYWEQLGVDRIPNHQRKGARWLGVNMTLTPKHQERYQSALNELEAHYVKVWEDRSSVDRYNRPVLSQIYDLSLVK